MHKPAASISNIKWQHVDGQKACYKYDVEKATVRLHVREPEKYDSAHGCTDTHSLATHTSEPLN
jgi:uncharacterized CHY-type Zn-finger protein